MVQKYTLQVCQKLALAAALAATLSCLPAVAQTSQTIDTLTVNGKPMSFAEFLQTYPNEAARDKILSANDVNIENAFYKWQMAQLKKRSAEQDAEMARVEKRIAGKKVALKLITEMNIVLDELTKEQAASKPLTPEKQIINEKRAMTIMAALANPVIASGMKPEIVSILRIISDNLQKGGNLTQLNIDLVKNVKILPSE